MGGGTPSPPRGYVRARAPMSNGFNSPWDASLDNAVRQFWPTMTITQMYSYVQITVRLPLKLLSCAPDESTDASGANLGAKKERPAMRKMILCLFAAGILSAAAPAFKRP